jgi:hypothetical protein
MGKSDTAYAWVEYGDEGDDLYKRTAWKLVQKSSLFGYEAVMLPLRNLKPETQYSYRVVVQDMNGAVAYGHLGTFRTNRDIINEKPTFTQVSAKNVRVHTVEFKAFVDMNDFDDGAVFLLYGKENAEITAVPASYTTYDRIHERGDALQKVLLDDSLSTNGLYSVTIDDLDRNTNYYYAFGTAYEGVDRKDVITLGSLGGVRTQQ